VLALFGNFDFTEILVIGVGALLVFGRRLPDVAMKAAAQVIRMRRAVSKMWREAGIEEELRRVRREIEIEPPREPARPKAPQPKPVPVQGQDQDQGQARVDGPPVDPDEIGADK